MQARRLGGERFANVAKRNKMAAAGGLVLFNAKTMVLSKTPLSCRYGCPGELSGPVVTGSFEKQAPGMRFQMKTYWFGRGLSLGYDIKKKKSKTETH